MLGLVEVQPRPDSTGKFYDVRNFFAAELMDVSADDFNTDNDVNVNDNFNTDNDVNADVGCPMFRPDTRWLSISERRD